jgi:hypothetical protein
MNVKTQIKAGPNRREHDHIGCTLPTLSSR